MKMMINAMRTIMMLVKMVAATMTLTIVRVAMKRLFQMELLL